MLQNIWRPCSHPSPSVSRPLPLWQPERQLYVFPTLPGRRVRATGPRWEPLNTKYVLEIPAPFKVNHKQFEKMLLNLEDTMHSLWTGHYSKSFIDSNLFNAQNNPGGPVLSFPQCYRWYQSGTEMIRTCVDVGTWGSGDSHHTVRLQATLSHSTALPFSLLCLKEIYYFDELGSISP